MKVVIIGSGNVAAVLGRKFIAAGHEILQVMSRNAKAASELAYEWNTESANYKSLINKTADVYIVAVADDAIEDVVADVYLNEKIVAHTAAAVKMEVLKKVSKNYGVFYPLQSMRKEQRFSPATPIYIEAVNDIALKTLCALAESIYENEGGLIANYDKRAKLHVAAVLVNNFSNYVFLLAEEFCKREGLNFKELLPLLDNTFYRLHEALPSEMQTGPAVRGDMDTIEKHIELLNSYPELQKIYKVLTDSILGRRL